MDKNGDNAGIPSQDSETLGQISGTFSQNAEIALAKAADVPVGPDAAEPDVGHDAKVAVDEGNPVHTCRQTC